MSSTTEYKDNKGEWRLRHKNPQNGNITLASSEGYKNRQDLKESMINACIEVLGHYSDELSEEQKRKIKGI